MATGAALEFSVSCCKCVRVAWLRSRSASRYSRCASMAGAQPSTSSLSSRSCAAPCSKNSSCSDTLAVTSSIRASALAASDSFSAAHSSKRDVSKASLVETKSLSARWTPPLFSSRTACERASELAHVSSELTKRERASLQRRASSSARTWIVCITRPSTAAAASRCQS
eukprot:scaffold216212_cov32-Tisochrysis_lutea.AAC.5